MNIINILFPRCTIDRSTEEIAVRSLESCSASLNESLSWYIWIVVIGVVFEIVPILVEYVEDRKKWKQGIIRSPEKPTVPHLVIHLCGAVLVAIGVGGELWLHTESGKTDQGLVAANAALDARKERENESKLAGVRLEAATANSKAAAANERAKAAEAELASQQAALAKEQAAAAKSTKDALDLQTKVNGSFLHRLLDRHVDIRLEEFLKTLPPASAEIRTLGSDTEAIIFAYELRAALREAGWTVPPVLPVTKQEALTGVTITNRSADGFIPFTGEMPLAVVTGLLEALGERPADLRFAALISALQVRTLAKDPVLANGEFRITIGENVLPNGFALPPK
jgi:hypothetical protein